MTLIIIAIVLLLYVYKAFRRPQEVRDERNHPIKINFFPAFPKGLLIVSIALLSLSITRARVFRIVGTSMILVFTLLIFKAYIDKPFAIKHLNPARFIPVVSNIVVPITGIVVFPQYPEISRFFFSVGLLFRLALFILFLNRAIFHHPLPQKLLPTLTILMAPPAIGMIAYTKLQGSTDTFSSGLFFVGCFLLLFLLINVKKFLNVKFYLSWWAYSFPLAAMTLSHILMYHDTEQMLWKRSSLILSVSLGIVMLLLIVRTIQNISNKTICVEEE